MTWGRRPYVAIAGSARRGRPNVSSVGPPRPVPENRRTAGTRSATNSVEDRAYRSVPQVSPRRHIMWSLLPAEEAARARRSIQGPLRSTSRQPRDRNGSEVERHILDLWG